MQSTEFMLLLFFIILVSVSYSGVSEGFGFSKNNRMASDIDYKVKNAYLNGVGTNHYGTGTAYQKISSSCTLVHVQGNLPDTQSVLEREIGKPGPCKCHCNSLFDCKCNSCKNYQAYIINPNTNEEMLVGQLQKFRDGQFRITNNFGSKDVSKYTKVVVRFDKETPVLYGSFTDFR